MNIYKKLNAIQFGLKAPKTQFNKFGGYNYRKAEDILEAVKPLLNLHGCALTCTDEIVQIGERYYVKAIATLIDTEADPLAYVQVAAYAREEAEKKGMDGSQVTGASSSYARKYALNGLLCIDDTQDSDTTNVGDGEAKKEAKKAPAKKSAAKIMTRQEFAERWSSDEDGGGITWDDIAECAKAWGVCSNPKCMEMTRVRELVLQAAGLSPRLKPLQKADAEAHAKWVKAIAEGAVNKDGKTAEQAFKEKFSPTQEQWQAVLDEAFAYKLDHEIK